MHSTTVSMSFNAIYCYFQLYSSRFRGIFYAIFVMLSYCVLFLLDFRLFLMLIDFEKLRKWIRLATNFWRSNLTAGTSLVLVMSCAILGPCYHPIMPSTGTQGFATNSSGARVETCSGVAAICDHRDVEEQQAASSGGPGNIGTSRQAKMARDLDSLGFAMNFKTVQEGLSRLAMTSSSSLVALSLFGFNGMKPSLMNTRFASGCSRIENWLIRSLVLLGSLDAAEGKIIQKYKLLDPSGYETSFLYKGGSLTISCKATGKGETVQLINQTGEMKPIGGKSQYEEVSITLDYSYSGQIYGCSPWPPAKVPFVIPLLYCDPFDLKPAKICQGKETCILDKTGTAKCQKLDINDCFLAKFVDIKQYFTDSLPKLRISCFDSKITDNNGKTGYGLCHAQTIDHGPIFGLAEDVTQCAVFAHFSLNNKSIVQDKLFFETDDDPKTWQLSYMEYLDGKCTVINSNNEVIAYFKKSISKKSVKPSNTTSLGNYQKPYKMKLRCSGVERAKETSVSTYMILFDPNPSLYSIKIQHKSDSKDGSLQLICTCDVPSGFVCQLNWTKPDSTVKNLESIPDLELKTLSSEDQKSERNVTCYLQVWTYQHPGNNGLVKVPLDSELKRTIAIPKQKESKFGKTDSNDNDKENPHGVNNSSNLGDSNKGSDKDSGKTTGIVIGVLVSCFLVVAVIAILAVWIVRKRKQTHPAATDVPPLIGKHQTKDDVAKVETKEKIVEEDKETHNEKKVEANKEAPIEKITQKKIK